MKLLIQFFAIYCLICIQTVQAADVCRAGESRVKESEPCIPNHLRNYLYCLITSGGGKVEIIKKDDAAQTKNVEINLEGKGSGIVIKGEGSGGFKQAESNRAVKELSEKIDPSLAARCESLSKIAVSEPKKSKPEVSKPKKSKPEVSEPKKPKPEVSEPKKPNPVEKKLSWQDCQRLYNIEIKSNGQGGLAGLAQQKIAAQRKREECFINNQRPTCNECPAIEKSARNTKFRIYDCKDECE